MRISTAVLLSILISAAVQAGPLTVRATSPRVGLSFTDAEPVEVRASVDGATARAVAVSFIVSEWEGPWKQEGQVSVTPLREGAGAAVLPLRLPGRGLYRLKLAAVCGDSHASCETSVGVFFRPDPPAATSPWGIFYIPRTLPGRTSEQSMADLARNLRLLGASWVRFNFWAHIFGKVTVTPGATPPVTADWSAARQMVRALRAEGLHVMGEVSQCPRELSSRATETEVVGDAGPVYNRVKPADYGLWDTLMTRLAADFAGEIDVWEIWNEANLGNVYWTGTVEDFAELVQHTSRALRRGNPQTKIAAAGFVGGHDFADRLLQLGMGRELDILSVHYTDLNPEHLPAWQALLDKHDLKLPLWNTEERSEVPLQNLAGPIERSFKFCHLNVGYEDYRPLVNLDLTPRPSAVWYAVGAHCLGTAKYVGTGEAPAGLTLRLFARGEERIGALTPEVRTGELLTEASRAIIAAEPLRRGAPVEATDSWGKTTQLRLRDGQATVPLRRMLFITGARRVRVVSLDTGRPASVVIAEAESGRHAPGWYVGTHDGFSQGKTVDVWSDADPGPEGYWITVPFSVPVAGAYDVLFAGNSLARLSTPRSLSPFVWQIDGGPEQTVAAAVPVTADVAGAPEGLSALGNVRLAAGDHVFHLRLTARREVPDQRWALWFDALALRRTIDE